MIFIGNMIELVTIIIEMVSSKLLIIFEINYGYIIKIYINYICST